MSNAKIALIVFSLTMVVLALFGGLLVVVNRKNRPPDIAEFTNKSLLTSIRSMNRSSGLTPLPKGVDDIVIQTVPSDSKSVSVTGEDIYRRESLDGSVFLTPQSPGSLMVFYGRQMTTPPSVVVDGTALVDHEVRPGAFYFLSNSSAQAMNPQPVPSVAELSSTVFTAKNGYTDPFLKLDPKPIYEADEIRDGNWVTSVAYWRTKADMDAALTNLPSH